MECIERLIMSVGSTDISGSCRSCPRKEIDFGGCRCQAALLTGDPANTDPACEFSPHHRVVREAAHGRVGQFAIDSCSYRQNP